MDSSIFKQNQTQFSIFTDPNANWNDQPVDYGPLVFKVMDAVSKRLGGVEYLIGELGPKLARPRIFSLGKLKYQV